MNKHTQQSLYGKYIYPYLQNYIPENSDVLEVGCGEGGLLEVFWFHRHNVMGVEICEARAKKARVPVIVGDICDYNPSEREDLIIMVDVIEHLKDPLLALLKVHYLLKPGGYLYITFPPKHSPYAGHQQHHKLLKYIPWVSLLPASIIKLFRNTDAIIENKRMAIPIRAFENEIEFQGFEIIEKNLYLIRPQYKIRYGWKPRINKSGIKYLNLGAEYLLRKV